MAHYVDKLLLALVLGTSCLVSEHDIIVPPSRNTSSVTLDQDVHIKRMYIVPPFGFIVFAGVQQRVAEGDIVLPLFLLQLRFFAFLVDVFSRSPM